MKIRTGFVSNSSTSSFIIAGVPLKNLGVSEEELIKKINEVFNEKNEEDDELYEALAAHGIDEVGGNEGCFIIGKEIVSFSDESGIEEIELSQEQINQAFYEVAEFLKKLGFTNKVKLYGGVESC